MEDTAARIAREQIREEGVTLREALEHRFLSCHRGESNRDLPTSVGQEVSVARPEAPAR